jgi:tripartite motif-containing protein 71
MSFKEKYLKYKNKYLELKKQIGGCKICKDPICIGGELCENASRPAAEPASVLSSPFEDFLESNGQYVLPYLQYPEGCALGAVGPVTMAMATTVRRWDWLPFFVGTLGVDDGQFYWPQGIAFSSRGDIFVCDTYIHRIQVFDRCGNYVRQWGTYGLEPGEFNVPSSVAISSTDEVYVCDSYNHRIQVFDLSGNLKNTFGSLGRLNGEFNQPMSVTIHGDQVFVSDTFNHRIQVYDLNGNYSHMWGNKGSKPGEFNNPRCLAVSSAGDVVVCDYDNRRVQVFDLKGTFKYSYGDSSSDPKADWRPRCVAISSANEVFIGDNKYSRVLVFTIDGTFIRYVELPAGTNGAFMPFAIAVSPSGLIIICDRNNNRIYIMPHGA